MQDIPAVRLAHQLREMNDGENVPTEGDIEKMNEELDALSAKHPGAGYQSGIRRGIREAREIFEKYMGVTVYEPYDGEPLLTPEKNPSKYNHAVEEPFHSINSERRCVEFTCYYNTAGFCQSVTDLWNPDLGEQCPDFSED